jgi:hypothetical protein
MKSPTLRKRLEDGHPKKSARESHEEQQLMFLIVAAAIERGPCTIFPIAITVFNDLRSSFLCDANAASRGSARLIDEPCNQNYKRG